VPSRWEEANVVPVPKIQPPRVVESDLRPISLTPTLAKVLESLCRVVDSGVRGRQLGRPAVRRPKTPVNYACLGQYAAPLAYCNKTF